MSPTLVAIQLREALTALACATGTLESARAKLLCEPDAAIAARHLSIAITEAENARLRAEEAIRSLQEPALARGPELRS